MSQSKQHVEAEQVEEGGCERQRESHFIEMLSVVLAEPGCLS